MASAVLPSLKLYLQNPSPYCLKVLVAARELNLIDAITQDFTVIPHPTKTTTPHSSVNPNGKIPALTINDSISIFSSENICSYLNSIAQEDKKILPPPDTLERYEVLTTESLCAGICDAALLIRYERLDRPQIWDEWFAGQLSKITRSIPILASRDLPDPETPGPLRLDGIAAAVALWYIDMRAGEANWKSLEGGDKLSAWLEKVEKRKSIVDTPFPQRP